MVGESNRAGRMLTADADEEAAEGVLLIHRTKQLRQRLV